MPYTADQCKQLILELHEAGERLTKLMRDCVIHALPFNEGRAAHHLRFGAARRIGVVRTAIMNIFEKFPPDTERPLKMDDLHDVDINLHAFVMNVSGIFDNLAWAFIERHSLRKNHRGVNWIGMFHADTRRYLPEEIRIRAMQLDTWHSEYLKVYRDALAHRVPLYVPPFHIREEDAERYSELEKQKEILTFDNTPEGLIAYKAASDEQEALTRPLFVFWHNTDDDGAHKLVQLHPQLISDCMTVLDMGGVFLSHWHKTK